MVESTDGWDLVCCCGRYATWSGGRVECFLLMLGGQGWQGTSFSDDGGVNLVNEDGGDLGVNGATSSSLRFLEI
jgi:hypothetical protein